jgi:ribosome-associated heat shock protein Hsp15
MNKASQDVAEDDDDDADEPSGSTRSSGARIDRWLFFVRLFKSRSIAAQAVSGGRVHINGARVKPSHAVRPGDLVGFKRGAVDFECSVIALPARRGPASDAVRAYEEKPESRARREQFAARMKVAAGLTPRPEERPDKHQRRELRRLRGRD